MLAFSERGLDDFVEIFHAQDFNLLFAPGEFQVYIYPFKARQIRTAFVGHNY